MIDSQEPKDIHSDSEVLLETVITDQFIDNEVEISSSKLEESDVEANKAYVSQCPDMLDKFGTEVEHNVAKCVDTQVVETVLKKETVTELVEATDNQEEDDTANWQQEAADLVKLCMVKQVSVNAERLNLSKVAFSQNIQSLDLLSKSDDSNALCKRRRKKKSNRYADIFALMYQHTLKVL